MDDLTGKTFGYLEVVGIASVSRGKNGARWLCKCVCGSTVVATGGLLKAPRPHNCGCKTKELMSARFKKHGHAMKGGRRREYTIYHAMKQRCLNPAFTEYENYGGRGIKVCDRWLESYDNFLEDMGPSPDGFQIDRIDPNGHYEPSNCRWVSQKDQARNKRSTVWVEYEGEKIPLIDLADRFGIPRARLYQRVVVRGLPIAEALKEGLNYHAQELEFNGVKKSLKTWAKEAGLKPHTLYYRINKLGWSLERALSSPVNRLP